MERNIFFGGRIAITASSIIVVGVICFFVFPVALWAQRDSSVILEEAIVRASRFQYTGFSRWQADTLPVTGVQSLANRLFEENILTVRLNAPGTLATLSARGAGASRTPVFWNGWNLQSPMNGVVDASLLPLWQGDQLQLLRGGYSAAQSSGAMGGTVEINTLDFPEKTRAEIGLQGGSFGTRSMDGSYGITSGAYSGLLRARYARADNNFPFTITGLNGKPVEKRQLNNFGRVGDIQQCNQWTAGKHSIRTAGWLQWAFREIPPTTIEAPSERWQQDQSARFTAQWQYRATARNRLVTDAAWLDESLDFRHAGKTDRSRSHTLGLKSEWRAQPGPGWTWRAGMSETGIFARADGYREKNTWFRQNRLATYASMEKLWFHQLRLSGVVRQEWADWQATPFTWSLGAEYRTVRFGKLRGHFSRNFNLPTFNDRFWQTLGNPALKPEKGYSSDLGWEYQTGPFSCQLSGYQILLNDWILWSPGADGLFRPGNLRRVRSRGLELTGKYRWSPGRWRLNFGLSGQWSDTRNIAVYDGSEASLNKQLPYTPGLSAGGSILVSCGPFSATYLHQLTGRRYVTSDNLAWLNAFQTGDLLCQWVFQWGKREKTQRLTVGMQWRNLWNTSYQWLINQPLPGRNWSCSVDYSW